MAKREMPDKKVIDQEKIQEPIRLTVINCNRLNVREGPNQERKILFVIPEGTVVIVEQMTTFDNPFIGDWLYVHLEKEPQKKGYVLIQYVAEV